MRNFFFALALFLCATLQTQGAREAAVGYTGTVSLEARAEPLVAVPGDVVVNPTNQVCGSCKCCLNDRNPPVCLTSCCFDKTCNGTSCTLRYLSCGCTICKAGNM
ncbi:hypothetical protein ACP70R_005661 [Stipagrostis hirtigluma subsp. patula]